MRCFARILHVARQGVIDDERAVGTASNARPGATRNLSIRGLLARSAWWYNPPPASTLAARSAARRLVAHAAECESELRTLPMAAMPAATV